MIFELPSEYEALRVSGCCAPMNPRLKLLGDKEIPVTVDCATVTLTLAAVAVRPAESRARAESVCAPLLLVAVFQETVYGPTVTSAPSVAPSSRNCTPATVPSSEADAVTVTVPDTVVPEAGTVIETVGGIVSGAVCVTSTSS